MDRAGCHAAFEHRLDDKRLHRSEAIGCSRGRFDSLPALPLDGGSQTEPIAAKATGTDDSRPALFAPAFAPDADVSRKLGSIAVRTASSERTRNERPRLAGSCSPANKNTSLTTAVNEVLLVERKGIEPSTFALRTRRSPNSSHRPEIWHQPAPWITLSSRCTKLL